MPQKYTPYHKAAAMVQLERNNGDTQTTASQLGIPVRTLQDWSRGIQAYLLPRAPLPARDLGIIPAFDNDLETLAFIRKHIMDEMLRLAVSLNDSPSHSTPYQRVLVLSQLMDKLMKLDQHLQPYQPADNAIRIEYIDQDGNVHTDLPQSDDDSDKFWLDGVEDEEPNGDGYDDDSWK
jgi:FAD/FMN-containing dehydrogenase